MAESTKELIGVLKDSLPSYAERSRNDYYLEEIKKDLSATRKLFAERVDQRDYSDSHAPGPLEIDINLDDSEMIEALDRIGDATMAGVMLNGIANEHLDRIDDNTAITAAAGVESVKQLILVRRGTDVLPDMNVRLGELTKVSYANLAATVISAGVRAYEIKQVRRQIDDLTDGVIDGFEVTNENLEMIHEDMADGFEMTNENLAMIHEDMVDGFEMTNENLAMIHEDMVDGHNAIIMTVSECAAALERAVNGGFDDVVMEIAALRDEQRKAVTVVALAFRDFNREQECRHTELVGAITNVAENRNALEADEKYRFAMTQFEAGNYRKAVQELDKALAAQSTHLPSLLLFAKIAASRADWSNAKDTYFHASKIALLQSNLKAYELAILALAELEEKLGNGDQAHELRGKAMDDWGPCSFEEGDEKREMPVRLYFEYFKKILYTMAERVTGADFDKAIEHFDYDAFSYFPFEPEANIDVDAKNKELTDRARPFVEEWTAKMNKYCDQIKDSGWMSNSGPYLGNKSRKSLQDLQELHRAWQQEYKALLAIVNQVVGEDPDSAYHISFICFDWMEKCRTEYAAHLEWILDKKTGFNVPADMENPMRSYILSDVRVNNLKLKRREIKDYLQSRYPDAGYQANELDDFISSTESLKASCYWLRNSFEGHLTDENVSQDKKREAMKNILTSVYNPLLELVKRFEAEDSSPLEEDELEDLREKMEKIDRVISNVCLSLEGSMESLVLLGKKQSPSV